MKQVLKYAGYVLLLVAIGFLIWKFYYILVWILIAAILSFIGQPMVHFFGRLHIKKLKIPHPICALLALLVIVIIFLGLLSIFVPLIVNQAQAIAKIDVSQLAENLQSPLQWLEKKSHSFGIIPEGQTLPDYIITKGKTVVNLGSVGVVLGGVFNFAGNFFLGGFAILFISFFFLKDENMFEEGLFLFIPEKHHTAVHNVVAESKGLLKRYFIGVILEVFGVMTLIAIGLWIFGVKNALLIGFFGGIMNIIPYLGPIIGSLIALTLGLTTTMASGDYNDLLPVLIKIASIQVVVNFIDNNVLVPLIYSKSVKSHPLEIFIVIIMGGSLAGLPGMLLAVPVYTVLRVIAKEFLQNFRVVQKLTETMDKKTTADTP
jgi:predicted PurR-regulated permease PerM